MEIAMISIRTSLLTIALTCGAMGANATEPLVTNGKVAFRSLGDAKAFKGAFAKYDKLEMGLSDTMYNDLSTNGVTEVTKFNSAEELVKLYIRISTGNYSCGFFHKNSGFGIMTIDGETVLLGYDNLAKGATPASIGVPNLRCFKRK